MATSESDEWTDDDDVALYPLSAVDHYAILLPTSHYSRQIDKALQIGYVLLTLHEGV